MSDLEQAARLLARAQRIAVLTGAGVSAESGVPTFRGAGGFWGKYRPEDLATPEGFARDPNLVWNWYQARRRQLLQVQPNPAHYALARMERELPARVTIITQNIDGLHQRAGSKNVIAIHGDLMLTICTSCSFSRREEPPFEDGVPRCPNCGALLRPGVVWFGELLPERELQQALEESHNCDVMLVVGTSAQVYPAAGFPSAARAAGAAVIEVNPDPALGGIARYVFAQPAGQALPPLVDAAVALASGGQHSPG